MSRSTTSIGPCGANATAHRNAGAIARRADADAKGSGERRSPSKLASGSSAWNVNGTVVPCQPGQNNCYAGFCGTSEAAPVVAGVAALTKTLAIELATSGVCVNALVPGVVRTDLNAALLDGTERGREFLLRTPMKRYGKVEELGGAAIFLASDAASFVTGHLLVVDGGFLASGVNQ